MLKNKIKKLLLAITTVTCVVSASGLAYAAPVNMTLFYDGSNHKYSAEAVKIKVNGEEINNLDVPPIVLNSRTMVPARAVFEKMGGEVTWNAEAGEVYIINDADVLVLKIDSDTGHVNGLDFKMDTTAKIINDRTMIPVRAAAEALGCTVGWNDDTRMITINEETYQQPVPDTPATEPPATEPPVTEKPSTEKPSTEKPSTSNPTGDPINVTGVSVPKSYTDSQVFTISTSGVVQKFECFMLDADRIVVDVYNANMNISNTNITATNSTIVSAVRSAQNQTTPNKIARVVFDVSSNTGHSATLSSDKKSIILSFEKNTITDLTAKSSGNSDVIKIYGDFTPAVNVSKSVNPFKLTVDIPNASNSLLQQYTEDLEYIANITTQTINGNMTRISMEAKRDIEYTVAKGDGHTTITVTKSTLENLYYDTASNTLILKNVKGLAIEDFTFTDDYRNGKYIVTLKDNYQDAYGYGTIGAGDGFVSNIVLANNSNGKTQFTVNENAIVAHKINVDANEIRIKFVSPKTVYDKVVVLDAGHGGTDPGTSGNGLTEKTINLDVSNRVAALLEADPNIKVYVTRVSDTYPTNINRAKMGNQAADLFVSIHQNAVLNNATAKGTEVLYTTHSTDVSGKLTSKIAAQFMQNYVVKALGTSDRGIKNRPDLIVLNQTTVPAVLIETAFLSNADDANIMRSEANRQLVAEAIYSAIADMMNQYKLR